MTIEVTSTDELHATQEKTYFVQRGDSIRFSPTGTTTVRRYSASSLLETEAVSSATTYGAYNSDMRFRVYCNSGITEVEIGDDTSDPTSADVHPYYHFHGYAGGQVAGDGKFFDLSGINHGIRGTNLSDAQMFTTAGYVSTVDPASGLTDSVIRIPSINFDYNSGEKLIVYWLGKVTAEASQQHIIGDGYSTSVRGWGITSTSAGKLQVIMSGASQGYSGTSSTTLFDGALHSFGVIMDGENRQYSVWSDDALDANFVNGYLSFNSGNDYDVASTSTVNIGAASPSPGGTSGIATATRALVIMRLPASYAAPAISDLTDAFKQLRTNPGKLILASAF